MRSLLCLQPACTALQKGVNYGVLPKSTGVVHKVAGRQLWPAKRHSNFLTKAQRAITDDEMCQVPYLKYASTAQNTCTRHHSSTLACMFWLILHLQPPPRSSMLQACIKVRTSPVSHLLCQTPGTCSL